MKTQASVLILLTMMATIAVSKMNMSRYGERNRVNLDGPDCGKTASCVIYTETNGNKFLTYLTADDQLTWQPPIGPCKAPPGGVGGWTCAQGRFECDSSTGVSNTWIKLPAATTTSSYPMYTCLVQSD